MYKKYLCGVTFQHELGETEVTLFDLVEDLKNNYGCWERCGIVEIEIEDEDSPELYTSHKWIVEQDMKWGNSSKQDPKGKTESDQ